MLSFDAKITFKKNNLKTLVPDIRREQATALDQGANLVLAGAQENIAEMGKIDTGNLLNSGSVQHQGAEARRIVFSADYALYVHEGHHTRSGSFVPAAPFLAKSMHENEPALERLNLQAVQRAVR